MDSEHGLFVILSGSEESLEHEILHFVQDDERVRMRGGLATVTGVQSALVGFVF